jgi:hypothetical protein
MHDFGVHSEGDVFLHETGQSYDVEVDIRDE